MKARDEHTARTRDLAALLDIIRDEIETCRHRGGVSFTDEADRYEALAAWLEEHGWPSDDAPDAWPCPLCDTPIGSPCFGDRNGHHCWRGWKLGNTHPGGNEPERPVMETCWPTVEHGPAHAYRGSCLGCEWRGPVRDDENDATEDAHDHTHPGWSDLPAVPSPTFDANDKQKAAWLAKVRDLYPAGWLDQPCAPIVTKRRPMGTRHHPDHSMPGYSIGRLDDDPTAWPTSQTSLL